MSEKKTIEIELNAEQAKACLRDVLELEHEVDVAGEGMGEKLEQGFEKAHHSSRHLAGGVNALASAFGDTGGEIGKMIMEAGHIAGLVGIIGPIGAAVAAVTFAVGELAEHFGGEEGGDEKSLQKAAKTAAEEAKKSVEELQHKIEDADRALQALGSGVDIEKISAEARTAKAKQDLEEKAAEFKDTYGEEAWKNIADFRAMAEATPDAQKVVDAYDKVSEAASNFADAEHLLRTTVFTGQLKEHLKEVAEAAKATKKALNPDEDSHGLAAVDADEDFRKQLSARNKIRAEARVKEEQEEFKAFDAEKKANADAAKHYAKEWENAYATITADEEKLDAERIERQIKTDKEISDRRQDEARQIAESMKQDIESAASSGTSAVLQYYAASAAGHKQAAKEAEAAFLESLGNQLVGMGQRDIFAGAGMIIAGDVLQGGAMSALGALEVAAGIGMGAAGSSMSAQVAASDAAAKKKETAHERGIHSGSGSSSGGGSSSSGTRTVTIVNEWGSGGPGADEYARSTVDGIVRAKKRGYL